MQHLWKTALIESKYAQHHRNNLISHCLSHLRTTVQIKATLHFYCPEHKLLLCVKAYVNPSSWALGTGPLPSVQDFKRTGMKPKMEWEHQTWNESQDTE